MQYIDTRTYDKNSKATAPAIAPYLHPVGNITAINYDVQGSTGPTNAGRLYQLIQAGTLKAEYIYNDLGQRTKKTLYQSDGITVASTTIYHYDQSGMLITETTETGTLIKDYIWQEGMMPVAQIDAVIPAQAGIQSIEAITYLYTDHLMTNRLATSNNGIITWRWEGEAFGNTPAQELSGVSINLRFPGQYYDSETNLHYNWNRYYDPALGRYITSDPIGLDGGMNTYSYAMQDSVRFIDPWGLIKVKRGVNISNISPHISKHYPAIDAAVKKHSDHNEAVITSGSEGKHGKDSKHYSNEAIDIRGKNVTDKQMKKIADEIKKSLGSDYDIIPEYYPKNPDRDHIHIEYDPKQEECP